MQACRARREGLALLRPGGLFSQEGIQAVGAGCGGFALIGAQPHLLGFAHFRIGGGLQGGKDELASFVVGRDGQTAVDQGLDAAHAPCATIPLTAPCQT